VALAVAVFIAGGLGALTRFAVDRAVIRRWQGTFLLGSFAVNVSGSFLLGLITGYTAAKVNIAQENLQAVVGTGFLGAFTTFSGEEWQTLALYRAGAGIAALSVVAVLAASLAVAALGLWIGGRV
jgi:fluoride exporter